MKGASLIWNSILKARDTLKDGFIFRIGGGQTPFWRTNWTGAEPLENLVPFVHIQDSALRICDVAQNGVWNTSSLFSFSDLRLLEDLPPAPQIVQSNFEDLWCWEEGDYTANSGYDDPGSFYVFNVFLLVFLCILESNSCSVHAYSCICLVLVLESVFRVFKGFFFEF